MQEPLKLNNHPVNQHAKFLLTQLEAEDDPERRYRLRSLNHVPEYHRPKLYLLELMEWALEDGLPEQMQVHIYGGNQQMLLYQVWELKEMPPLQAWKWLNLGKEHPVFQMTEDPIEGAEVALKVLVKGLVKEQKEIHGPHWKIGRRRRTDDDLIDWMSEAEEEMYESW